MGAGGLAGANMPVKIALAVSVAVREWKDGLGRTIT
jgi:hypothetical protein